MTQIAAALVIATGSMTQAAVGGTVLRRTTGYPAAFDNATFAVKPRAGGAPLRGLGA